MTVKAVLYTAIPGPWQPRRVFNRGWAHEVFSAEGKTLDGYYVAKTEGAMLASVHAMGPELLDYVLRAADKGGAEATALRERFNTLVSGLTTEKAP